jgi:hypothetical protein
MHSAAAIEVSLLRATDTCEGQASAGRLMHGESKILGDTSLMKSSQRYAIIVLAAITLVFMLGQSYNPDGLCPSGVLRDEQGNCLPELDPSKRGIQNFGGGMQTPNLVIVEPRLLSYR